MTRYSRAALESTPGNAAGATLALDIAVFSNGSGQGCDGARRAQS